MQINMARVIIEDLFSQKAALDAKIRELEDKCETIDSNSTFYETEYHKAMDDVVVLQNSLADSINRNANLHQTCLELQQNTHNSQLYQDNDQLQRTNTQLRSFLQSTRLESDKRAHQIRELQSTLSRYQHQIGLVDVEPSILDSARKQVEQAYQDPLTNDRVEHFSQPRTVFTFDRPFPHAEHTALAQPSQPSQSTYYTPAPSQSGRDFYTEEEYYPPQPNRPPPPPPLNSHGTPPTDASPLNIAASNRPVRRARGRL